MSTCDADSTYTCDFCGISENWMAVEDEDSEWEHFAGATWCGKCERIIVFEIGVKS